MVRASVRLSSFYKPKEQMRTDLQQTCIGFLVAGIVTLMCKLISFGAFAILGESTTQRLRVAMLKQFFRQEIGFHDDPENAPGMLAKSLELYTYRVSSFVSGFSTEAGALGSIIVGIVIAFYYCWQMALFMLGVSPIQMIAMVVQIKIFLGASKSENQGLKRAQQLISDSLQSTRTVQALGNERELVRMYEKLVKDSMTGYVQTNIKGGIFAGIANGLSNFITAASFAFAAYLVKEGQADFLKVFTGMLGVQYAVIGAARAAALASDATKAKVAAFDMFLLLDRQSKIEGMEPTGLVPKDLDSGLIEYRDVEFFYPFRPQVQVLRGVNFTINPGQSVGLVGPSGGGKSTVMSLLQRFYDPEGGQVLIGKEKVDLATINIRWWRRQIGFVGQEPILFNSSVRQNVLYGLGEGEVVSDEFLESCRKMANLDFLDKEGSAGWETEVGPKGSRLSGGQKQRVAICRALIRNPAVMLLDEATSALDNASEKVVQDALQEAMKGRTSFAIAHRLSTIANSDLILVVGEGVVLERGNHSELMALKGVYYKLHQSGK